MAREKYLNGEKSSFKKFFFILFICFGPGLSKTKGYEDGLFRIPLDLGFAYMEFVIYFLLFFYSCSRPRG